MRKHEVRNRGFICLLSIALLISLGLCPAALYGQGGAAEITPQVFEHLKWRNIGPAVVDGREVALAGVPGNPRIMYVGSASGGVWKTTDGGVTWKPIFDHENTISIGAIAVDPRNPDVVYVGTGEGTARNTVSFGDGIYKTTDGGKTWKNMGLRDTHFFTQIVINPHNPNIVYAAALGHIFGPNPQRGVFKTTDGGKTWKKVLYLDDMHGAADLAINEKNPHILYATMWYFLRRPWTFTSGDTKGGLFKSVDGGRTWRKITKGLPKLMGRTGVQVSLSNPNIVYLIAESNHGTLFRSNDGGDSFHKVSDNPQLLGRGPYYAQLRIDPANPNRLYAIAMRLWLSIDGGHTWKQIAENVHSDHHAIWIDPKNPDRLWQANDGQIAVSYNRGKTWEALDVYAATQAYHIFADNEVPFYHVTVGLQDNGVFTAFDGTREGGIENSDWSLVEFGDGFYGINNILHPNIYVTDTQGGRFARTNVATQNSVDTGPQPERNDGGPANGLKYRFNWNSPIVQSPHDPNTIYFAGNVVFKSTDFGKTWQRISPDLTTDNPSRIGNAGGPVWNENTTAEYYCTIISLAESPAKAGVIWAGTDDGNLQVTTNDGKTWTNVIGNVQGVPAHSEVWSVEPSRTAAGTAYVVFQRHMFDDYRPYVYKTTDFGKTWQNISGNLPQDDYAWVIREDPKNPKLLYLGTALGLYASFTGGNHWIKLNMANLPDVAVRDMMIHPKTDDLLLATYGRGAWIFDDAAAIQQMSPAVLNSNAYLFRIRTAMRYTKMVTRFFPGDKTYSAPNPPYGAIITYYLKNAPDAKTPVKIEILDANGKVLREMNDIPRDQGLNRTSWNLRVTGARQRYPGHHPSASFSFLAVRGGPQVPPGKYTVRLIVGQTHLDKPVQVVFDPHANTTTAALDAQYNTAMKLRDMLSTANDALRTLDSLQSQIHEQQQAVRNQFSQPPADLDEALANAKTEVKTLLDQLAKPTNISPYSQGPKLSNQISRLMRGVDATSTAPTQPQMALVAKLQRDLSAEVTKVNTFIDKTLPSLNATLRQHGASGVVWAAKPVAMPR